LTTRAPELGDGLALAAAVPPEVEARAELAAEEALLLVVVVVEDRRVLVVGATEVLAREEAVVEPVVEPVAVLETVTPR
jgi:hypothetical protein